MKLSVDSTAWPVIRVKVREEQAWKYVGLLSRGQVGQAGASRRRVSRDSLPGGRQQPLPEVGSAGGRLAGGGGLCQGLPPWVQAWLGQQGEGDSMEMGAASQRSVGRCVCSRPVSQVAPPGLASGAASWRSRLSWQLSFQVRLD